MRERLLQLLLTAFLLIISISVFSQELIEEVSPETVLIDSLKNSGAILDYSEMIEDISLSTEQAIKFLQDRYQIQYWNDPNDPLRIALGQLIYRATFPPYDSSVNLLKKFPYDSLNIPWDKFYIWEPLHLRIPVIPPPDFRASIDSISVADTSIATAADTIAITDTIVIADTAAINAITDTTGIVQTNDSLNKGRLVIPDPFGTVKKYPSPKDTIIMVIIDTLSEASLSNSFFPFKYLNSPYQGDSIEVAVQSLIQYIDERDSTLIHFTGKDRRIVPVWMNSKEDMVMRFWLKNEFSDSVTVWIGNPSKNTFGLYLEQGINFRRPVKQGNYADAKINVQQLDNSKLLDIQKIIVKHQYWKYRSEAVFTFNQTALTNWVKGGENSISTSMDITGYGDYENKSLKLSSKNFARLKLGFLASGDKGIRKNLDLIETNSKLNHKAFGKFDFSGIMLFKTQLAPGYKYSTVASGDTSVLVSKFMNPGILTVGFGLDYKPNKETSINLSPFSYKGTYVSDTLNIDQTQYGIAKDKKSKNEPGASFMISNVYKPYKWLNITNRLQLFTNYINNPLNIDIDWEMIAVAHINWFTDVRFNTHLIFDDDTKTPITGADGIERKTARAQFKEILGFSFVFRF